MTGDGAGNPFAMPGPGILLIGDFTPIEAVVEDPGGGLPGVDDHLPGEAWSDERSEGLYAFVFLLESGEWSVASFGLGYQ